MHEQSLFLLFSLTRCLARSAVRVTARVPPKRLPPLRERGESNRAEISGSKVSCACICPPVKRGKRKIEKRSAIKMRDASADLASDTKGERETRSVLISSSSSSLDSPGLSTQSALSFRRRLPGKLDFSSLTATLAPSSSSSSSATGDLCTACRCKRRVRVSYETPPSPEHTWQSVGGRDTLARDWMRKE